jgi:phosphoglucomutase
MQSGCQSLRANRSPPSSPRPLGTRLPIGGLKVIAANGWFTARPSGPENICKIYLESFKRRAHLEVIPHEAQAIVNSALEVKS